MHRQIAGKLTGRVTKWIVLAVWLVILVVAGGFAAKLTDVQNNEASSWLPASAESTRALDKLDAVPGPERPPDHRRLPVRRRAAQQADLAAIEAQARFARDAGRWTASSAPPPPSSSGPGRLRGRRRSPRRRSRSTSARTAGTRCRTPPPSSATSRPSTA